MQTRIITIEFIGNKSRIEFIGNKSRIECRQELNVETYKPMNVLLNLDDHKTMKYKNIDW